jgi:hypothetical protein
MIKVDHQSYDNDKEDYNVMTDKKLFKSTNWFFDSGVNNYFCHNINYFI